jgi:type IV secretory pathway VirB4 component
MYVILNYIWNKVKSSNRKRILVIDEAWNIMQYDDSAKFLFGLVKRARKYNL